MKIEHKDRQVIIDFNDVIEYAEYANEVPSSNHSKRCKENEFCGGTFADAVTQAKTGNPEFVKKLFDGINIIEALIKEEKIGEIRDVTGEYFDVGDYLSGEPEVFRRDEYGPQKPVIPVYANFSMNGGISNTLILNRGCAIVALIDELQQSGFIVDLVLLDVTTYNGKKYYTKIRVATNPVDLDTVAFIIANPLCLRRLWFAVLEHCTGEDECDGYGRPAEYDLDDLFSKGISGFYFTGSGHRSFSRSYWHSLQAAKDHIMDMAEQFKNSAAQVILG